MDQPPRSSSVHGDDYDPSVGARTQIFLDGVKIDKVIRYDCDKGEVERYQTDAAGNYIVLGDEAATELLMTGNVEVQFKAEV